MTTPYVARRYLRQHVSHRPRPPIPWHLINPQTIFVAAAFGFWLALIFALGMWAWLR